MRAGTPEDAASHDHAYCISRALARAEQVCAARGLRLTPLRRRVLELVWEGHRPVGAYDILDRMRADGRRAAPPTVYRSLEFLVANGLVHRIESLNAFVGCDHPHLEHEAHFFICRDCGNAIENEPVPVMRALQRSARAVGFEVESGTIEIHGRCADCRQDRDG